MGLNCIRNQPIDFCDRLECYDEAFCIRVDTTDVSKFQIESTVVNGNELVQNGDFAASTGWTFGTGWAYDGTADEADATGATAGNELQQNGILTTGEYYLMSFQVKNYVSGTLLSPLGDVTANGTYYGAFIAGGTDLLFDPNNSFTGSIDNVSVKELTFPGIRIIDCATGEAVYDDYDNSDNMATFWQPLPLTQSVTKGRVMFTIDWDAAALAGLVVAGNCYKICLTAISDQIGCTFESQCICVATDHPGTVLITASNDENFDLGGDQYLDYTTATFTNFQLSMRVEAHFRAPHWEEDYDNFQFSDFARKTVKFSSVEVLDFTTEELPVSQHRALAAMVGHDTFTIGGVVYHKFGAGLNPEWPKGTDHAGFMIEVVEDSKGLKNSNC